MRVVLAHLRTEGWPWEQAWPRAIRSLPRLPRDASIEDREDLADDLAALQDPYVVTKWREAYQSGADLPASAGPTAATPAQSAPEPVRAA
jgi:hypothetical protein